jgi:hypothetical protein
MNRTRRNVLSHIGGASLATLAVLATATPAGADFTDAALIEVGNRFENLLLRYVDAFLKWAPLNRAANDEADNKVALRSATFCSGSTPEGDHKAAAQARMALFESSGCTAAHDQMSAVCDDMEPLAEAIKEAVAVTIGGLRAKALVVLYEAMPHFAEHSGKISVNDDDGGASDALFNAAVALTGLLPVVRDIEARIAPDATVEDQEYEAVPAIGAIASRDLDVAGILAMCALGAFPVNACVDVAIAAHRKAFNEDKAVALLAVRAVILARTPDVQDYRDQLAYLTALPLDAWEDRSDTPENIRRDTLAMIERQLQQAVSS